MPAISLEIEATISGDRTEHFPEGQQFFIPAVGGTIPAGPGGLNIRHVALTPDPANPPDGEMAADSWMMPTGLILVGASTSSMIVGKKVRITIEEIVSP